MSTATCVAKSAKDSANTKLNSVSQKYQKLSSEISQEKQQQQSVNQKIRQYDQKINQYGNTLHQLENKISLKKNQLALLEKNYSKKENALHQQQQALGEQIRAAYAIGKQNYLKVLLNQQDIRQFNRQMSYFGYLTEHRMQLIIHLTETMTKLEDQQQAIVKQTAALENLQQQQRLQQQQLNRVKQQQTQLLNKINHTIKNKRDRLNALSKDKKHLETILKKLHSNQPAAPAFQNFSSAYHHLPWPVSGRLYERFGSKIKNSDLTANGVVIKAPEGRAVAAVHTGKVVFSGWLKSYGLLIILDHGDGFMTLYGRNRDIYKKVGETVEQQETIATVGQSGGYSETGLYFEVRHNGHPEDPEKWCVRRNS